jgi:hypothetical protein
MIRKTTAIAIDDRVVKTEDDYADSRQNGCRRGPHKEDGNEENQKADCEYRQHAQAIRLAAEEEVPVVSSASLRDCHCRPM